MLLSVAAAQLICFHPFSCLIFVISLPAASTALQGSIDELRRELLDLKHQTVPKTLFYELKAENDKLKKDLDTMRERFNKRLNDVMQEVDEEKKLRLSTEVEVARIRKLVSESHV